MEFLELRWDEQYAVGCDRDNFYVYGLRENGFQETRKNSLKLGRNRNNKHVTALALGESLDEVAIGFSDGTVSLQTLMVPTSLPPAEDDDSKGKDEMEKVKSARKGPVESKKVKKGGEGKNEVVENMFHAFSSSKVSSLKWRNKEIWSASVAGKVCVYDQRVYSQNSKENVPSSSSFDSGYSAFDLTRKSAKPVISLETFDSVKDMALSDSANLAAFACANGFIELWDFRKLYTPVKNFLAHKSAKALTVDFNAEGTKLLTGGSNGEVRIWCNCVDLCREIQIGSGGIKKARFRTAENDRFCTQIGCKMDGKFCMLDTRLDNFPVIETLNNADFAFGNRTGNYLSSRFNDASEKDNANSKNKYRLKFTDFNDLYQDAAFEIPFRNLDTLLTCASGDVLLPKLPDAKEILSKSSKSKAGIIKPSSKVFCYEHVDARKDLLFEHDILLDLSNQHVLVDCFFEGVHPSPNVSTLPVDSSHKINASSRMNSKDTQYTEEKTAEDAFDALILQQEYFKKLMQPLTEDPQTDVAQDENQNSVGHIKTKYRTLANLPNYKAPRATGAIKYPPRHNKGSVLLPLGLDSSSRFRRYDICTTCFQSINRQQRALCRCHLPV